MKKPENKTLSFPPTKEPSYQTIVCQIGRERFAIHIEIEDLPPVTAPLRLMKPPLPTGKHPSSGFRSGLNKGLARVSERSDQCHEPAKRRHQRTK